MLIKEFLCFMLCFSGGCHNRRSIILKGTVEKRRKWGFSLENQIIRDQLKFVLYAALKQNAINAMNLCTPSCLKLTQIKWSIANLLNQLLCSPVLGIFLAERKCTLHLDCPNLTLHFHMIQRQNNKMYNFWQNFLFLSWSLKQVYSIGWHTRWVLTYKYNNFSKV